MLGAGYGETLSGETSHMNLYRQADSLEEWFERWLAGELERAYPHE